MTPASDDVQAWLEPRADEMAALLEELVAIDTENPPGRGLGRCGRFLHDALERLGLAPELIELAPSRELEEPCIVRASAGDGDRTIYFHGHFDVVPAQDAAQFRPVRRDGRISARGSADMKGGLVSMLYGALAARELGLLGDRRVVLHFVCDEETGSVAGSGHLRAAGLIDPGAVAMLTAEPTGGVIWHACRGAITLRVQTSGREAHVGYADQGINAFEHMIRIAEPLTALSHALLEKRSMLVVGGQAGRRRLQRRAGLGLVLDRPALQPRGVPRAGAGAAHGHDRGRPRPAPAPRSRSTCCRRSPRRHRAGSPRRAGAGRLCRRCGGRGSELPDVPGVLDTRWYSQLGIPAFAYGGGRLDVSHGPAEYIDESAMRNCAAVYALFVERVPG